MVAKTQSDKLTNALNRKDLEQMKRVLSKGNDGFVNQKNSAGYPPLAAAVSADTIFEEGVNLLLEQEGIDLNAQITIDEKKATPKEKKNLNTLQDATAISILSKKTKGGGNAEIASNLVNKLIDKGAKVNVQDNKGNTPLHDAIEARDYDLVQRLLGSGADPNTPNKSGFTPLHIAANNSDKQALDIMLEVDNIDVNKTIEPDPSVKFSPNKGANPLMLLAKNASFDHQSDVIEIAKSLIKKGSDINGVKDQDGNTSLHHATQRVLPEFVEILTASGADPRQQNAANKSAIDINKEVYSNIRNSSENEELKQDFLKANKKITEQFQKRIEKGASAAIGDTLGINEDSSDKVASYLSGKDGDLNNVAMMNKSSYASSQKASTNTDLIKDIIEKGSKSPTEHAKKDKGGELTP
jgi:ankyrin repeat protein